MRKTFLWTAVGLLLAAPTLQAQRCSMRTLPRGYPHFCGIVGFGPTRHNDKNVCGVNLSCVGSYKFVKDSPYSGVFFAQMVSKTFYWNDGPLDIEVSTNPDGTFKYQMA